MITITVRFCPDCDFTATAAARLCPQCHSDLTALPAVRIPTREYHERLDWFRDTITVTRHPGA